MLWAAEQGRAGLRDALNPDGVRGTPWKRNPGLSFADPSHLLNVFKTRCQ